MNPQNYSLTRLNQSSPEATPSSKLSVPSSNLIYSSEQASHAEKPIKIKVGCFRNVDG